MDNPVVSNNGRKEYTFIWFIENYSYCWHSKKERLVSPKFMAECLDSTVWALNLYPRGLSSKGKISLYLRHAGDVPIDMLLKFELAFLAAGAKSVLYSLERECNFKIGSGHGAVDFLDIDEVLQRRKALYLHQDTLIIRCKMWKEEGKTMKSGYCSARTRIGFEKISFLHKVENFSALKPNDQKILQIQSFSNPDCMIFSSLYFIDDCSFEGTLIVEILPSDETFILRKRKVSFLDRSGNIVAGREVDNRFDKSFVDLQKMSLPLTRQIIMSINSEYLPNDELSLICECEFSTGVVYEKIEEIQHELPLVVLKPSYSSPFNRGKYNVKEMMSACPSIQDDLKTIHNKQFFTDIVLKTKTKSFPAHKLILCARSPVFNALLNSNMKEKVTSCIQFDDLENDIVQQFLLFLYSDNIVNLQWESAIKLYYAADKYAIEKLKVLCSIFLVENLSAINASELLLLADTHSDSYLKKIVEDFILEYEDDVFGSDEFVKLIDTNPQLVIKTLHLKYRRKKGSK